MTEFVYVLSVSIEGRVRCTWDTREGLLYAGYYRFMATRVYDVFIRSSDGTDLLVFDTTERGEQEFLSLAGKRGAIVKAEWAIENLQIHKESGRRR